jgi:Fe-S cluster biogenesis protein NfuA
LPEGRARSMGMYAMFAHAHPWWLRGGYRRNGDEIKQLQRKEQEMREKVEKALEAIRPVLQADGGDVELVDVADGIVKVKLKGACGGCPMSQVTLTRGVEQTIKRSVPEVKKVEAV